MAQKNDKTNCSPLMVGSIMTSDVVTFGKNDSLLLIAKEMARQRISCVVIKKGDMPIGIITERDIINKVMSRGRDISALIAADIMSSPVLTIEEDTSHVRAAEMMEKNKVRRFVVVRKKKLVGIVTQSDVLNGMIQTIKKLNYELVSKAISIEKYLGELRQ